MFKTTSVKLLCVAASALAAFSLQADDGTTDSCGGFRGVADIEQGLVLTPTTNAPAYAKGKAEFVAVNDNGTNYEALFVKTCGLTNGVFTVSLTDDTGTNTYTLGTLNVSTVANPGDDDEQDQEDGQWSGGVQVSGSWSGGDSGGSFSWGGSGGDQGGGWTNWVSACAQVRPCWTNLLSDNLCTNLQCFATNACWWYTNTLTVGSGSFILPDGLSQTNAGVLTISDTNGVVYLTGDFSSVSNSTVLYHETADVVAGSDTNAQGSATLTYRLAHKHTVGTLHLKASGLPAHTKLYLTANGSKTIKVFTRHNGTLEVRGFPRLAVSSLTSLTATDASGNVVFTVNF